MREETHVWRWRKNPVAETFRQVRVALVVTGVVGLFLDPEGYSGPQPAR